MKAKLKGQSGIKGLLLLHGEKLIMAAFVLAAAYLIYASLRVQSLSSQYEPAKLEAQDRQTSNNIDTNTWDRFAREFPDQVRIGSQAISTDVFRVNPESYASVVLNPRIHERIQPRTDPILLAAAEVRATSGADLFAFRDDDVRRAYESRLQEEDAQRQRRIQKEQESEKNDTRPSGRRTTEETRPGFDPDHPNRWHVSRQMGGAMLSGGEYVEFNRWVSVVAKVPVKGQLQAYRRAFENASGGFNPNTDYPVYLGCFVERAEYVPGVAADALTWTPVPVYDARRGTSRKSMGPAMSKASLEALQEKAAKDWIGGTSFEIVHPSFMSPSGYLVYPLPPIVGRDWGREATHPGIPLVTDPISVDDAVSNSNDSPSTPSSGITDEGFGMSDSAMNAGNLPTRRVPPPDLTTPAYSVGGSRQRSPQSMPSVEIAPPVSAAPVSRRRTGASGTGMMGAAAAPVVSNVAPAEVDSYLLRFFDFTAEPGKLYTYRVRLVLSDPNLPFVNNPSGLDPAVLDRLRKAKDANGQMRSVVPIFAPWSEPSPPVGIPLDGRVRLVSNTSSDDPRVSLVVDGFGVAPKSGSWVQASTEKDGLTRGSVVNFSEDAYYLLESRNDVDRFDGKFNYATGIMVVDARGGERLGRNDLTAPSRVLLMGPAGDLKIRREMDDAADVKLHHDIFTKPKPVATRT